MSGYTMYSHACFGLFPLSADSFQVDFKLILVNLHCFARSPCILNMNRIAVVQGYTNLKVYIFLQAAYLAGILGSCRRRI